MAAQIAGVFEKSLEERIASSKVLVVGAGGIGCEVLKNLVMSGFPQIEIIDLDTIDVSNLNRQFLFHKEHVGKSKAEVARESALAFNPKASIKAYHDSIFNTNYGVTFFQQFNVVLNALDNRQARNHVNRMCLTADVPLIESGTSGYDGQVELIKKTQTQCYECQPKAAQKSFPGCTIRNTPSEPIHCIVWAKHLFNQLFGEHNEDEDVSPDTADPEAAASAGDAALQENANEEGNITRKSTRQWAQETEYDPEKIYNKLFGDDIKYLLSMSDLWKTRTPPAPGKYGEFPEVEAVSADSVQLTGAERDQKAWTLRECQNVFAAALKELKTEFSKVSGDDHLVWDKDDKYAMDFVASCANIRANIFHIQLKSRFEIKSMAGNIIPAIATTNAITAGIVVMRAFKVLTEKFDECQSVYVRLRPNPRNQIFVPDRSIMPPNPKCFVCSPKPEVVIKIDTKKVTVKQFRDDVLVKSLNTVDPDVIIDGKGVIVISSEEGETECNNDKTLAEMNIVDGCILKVDDFFQNYELNCIIIHRTPEREEALFEIIADPDTLKPENNKTEEPAQGSNESENGDSGPASKRARIDDNSDDDLCIVEDDEDIVAGTSGLSSHTSKDSLNGATSDAKPDGPITVEAIDDEEEEEEEDMDDHDDDEDDEDDDDDVCIIEDDDSNAPSTSSSDVVEVKKRQAEENLGEPSSKRTRLAPDTDDDDDDDDDDCVIIDD